MRTIAMSPSPPCASPLSTLMGNLLFGAALGVLLLALLVAANTAVHDLLARPDSLVAMIWLLLNLSGLFACALFATAFGAGEREPWSEDGAPPRRPGAIPLALAIRRSRAAASISGRSRDRSP